MKSVMGMKETLECRASLNARLWIIKDVLIVIQTATVPAACSQMFERKAGMF